MKTSYKIRICLTLFGVMTYLTLPAQENSVKYDLFSMSENNQLEAYNRNVGTFTEKEKTGVRLSKNENDGIAWLKHVIFSNGIIELDIRGKDELQQSFLGIAFHGMDNSTFDAVYFRPFNFRADDPVRKIHSVQYIAMPDYPWQVLREKFNGKYEKAVTPEPDPNDWFHVKIVVSTPNVTVYVNGSTEPNLAIKTLNERTSGKLGLWVGNNSEGDFANLSVTSLQ